MSFQQLKININSDLAEKISDIFFDLEALSVSIEDQYEGTELEQPIFNEPGMEVEKLWEHSTVVVLLSEDTDLDIVIKNAKDELGHDFTYILENIDDQDWVRLTQSQFEPIEITPKLFIVPSWHTIPNPDATGIILDPGLAFGTGSHPTTFMCLKYLSENITPHMDVLDYGCGSGILAIIAKKLEARSVDGVDIDEQAIESSIFNAENNQVKVNFYLPNEFETKQYDLVIANILSNPLRMLASALASYVKQNGKIVLSGILADQIEEMSNIYNQWFIMKPYIVQDGWASLEGIRK
ncbi:MAG: 50S ribosomal protein L11 methyltransferase [Burkholderiales bacterium]|nr:50S ribosomal protein L11 methyltransferase [Burkholderiales bacterium]